MTEEKLKKIIEIESLGIFSNSLLMKKIQASYASGMTKDVLIFKNKGFVLKSDDVPRRHSYCGQEYQNYLQAVNMGIERILLPTTPFCTCRDGVTFYKQPIYKMNADLGYSDSKNLRHKLHYTDLSEKRGRRLDKLERTFYDENIGNYFWLIRAVQYYGMDFMLKVADWTCENNINDLHDENIGFIANYRPIILDYSGFWGR